MAKNNSPLYQFGAASIAGAVAGLGLDGSVGADNTNQTVGAAPQTPDPINPDPLSAPPIPVSRNTPGSLGAMPPLPPPVAVPLPPAPNLAPINPNALSAPEAVAGVFGENTEGQYGRQSWNAQ